MKLAGKEEDIVGWATTALYCAKLDDTCCFE
jgi:hypothetical protein